MAHENEIKDEIAKHPIRFTKKITKMYNSMDQRCQGLARQNPGRPMSDYCERCQILFRKTLEGEF